MHLTDLKGRLIARQGNLTADLRQKRQTVVLMESDLIRARREADTVSGALQATERDLADVEAALQAAVPPPAPTTPAGVSSPRNAPGTPPATPRNG